MITTIDEKPLLEKRIRQVASLSKEVHEDMSIFSTLDDVLIDLWVILKDDLK